MVASLHGKNLRPPRSDSRSSEPKKEKIVRGTLRSLTLLEISRKYEISSTSNFITLR